ncbi:MAG: YlbF family regulator [Bacilli bacterium]
METYLDSEFLLALNNLALALNADERVQKLVKSERAMEEDVEVYLLHQAFRLEEKTYNQLRLCYDEEHEEVKEVRKKLYLAKRKFDEHPLVTAYRNDYREVEELYQMINCHLFAPLQLKEDCAHGDSHHCW